MNKLWEQIKNLIRDQWQIQAIKRDMISIRKINNPSKKVQIAAIEKDSHAIRYITNPFEKVQLMAVQQDPYEIRNIKNPTKKVQIAVLEKSTDFITLIESPCEEAQRIAVENDPFVLSLINTTETVQIEAIEKNPFSLQYIDNPSEKVQVEAMKRSPNTINLIKEPCEKALLIVIEQKGENILHIKNPSEKVQLAAVNSNSSNIIYINYSSEGVQLAAVKDNAYNILKIRNPKIEACKAAIQKEFGNIKISDQNVTIENTIALFSKMEETNKKYDEMWLRADYADNFEDRMREFGQADSWKEKQLSKALQEFTEGSEKLHINPDQREKVTDNDIKDLRVNAIQILQGNAPERFFENRFEGIREQFAHWSSRLEECLNDYEKGKTYNNIRMMSNEFYIKQEIDRTAKVFASEIRESFSPDDFSKYVGVLFKADNLEIGKVPTIEEALSLFSHKYLLPKEINSAVFENEESGKYEITRPNIQYDVFDNRNTQLMKAGTNPYSPNYKELFDNLGLKKEFNEFEKKCVEREGWNSQYNYAVGTRDIAEIYDLDRELPILDRNIEDSRKILYEGMIQKINTEKEIAIDKQTVEIFCIPDTIKKTKITEEDKEKLAQGEKVLIKGMISSKGTPFDAYVYVNNKKNTLAFDLPRKKEIEDVKKNNPGRKRQSI